MLGVSDGMSKNAEKLLYPAACGFMILAVLPWDFELENPVTSLLRDASLVRGAALLTGLGLAATAIYRIEDRTAAVVVCVLVPSLWLAFSVINLATGQAVTLEAMGGLLSSVCAMTAGLFLLRHPRQPNVVQQNPVWDDDGSEEVHW